MSFFTKCFGVVVSCRNLYAFVVYLYVSGIGLPRLGKRELICLLLFSSNYVVSVWRGFLFLWVLGMGYVILLWHSLSLPYNYLGSNYKAANNVVVVCWVHYINTLKQELNGTKAYEKTFIDDCR